MAASAPPFNAPAPYAGAVASSNTHPGKFAPGTKVQVGNHRVIVEKYLSEGGFAHVYVVRVQTSGHMQSAVLKRVAVPDKDALANMKTEVETMKKLKGHKHIVTYLDSHASQLKAGGYEVFLLMEYCKGGGLIDFMNTRLKNRLTEPEILQIFSDAAEGVACMHYLKPPLLHRDLKVENILIQSTQSSKTYKLCDFGSSAPPRPAASSAAEGRLIEDDVQKHTTLQYRSPEMIDVYQKRPIDEKSDIWALGVLLYKLCYYTTPFEAEGTMAILNASFKYPAMPRFSDRLKKLIAMMLMREPRDRPNIYQVLVEVCAMRGKQVPIKDIYSTRTHSEARKNERLPDRDLNITSPPTVGATREEPEHARQALPDITPMRRGRPTSANMSISTAKESKDTAKNRDPFAALDSPSYATRSKAVDELSAKFPSAEQFSLLQDKQSSFEFQSPKSNTIQPHSREPTTIPGSSATGTAPMASTANEVARSASLRVASGSKLQQVKPLPKDPVSKPLPERPKMVSTGTMTSAASSPPKEPVKPLFSNRPIWRVPPPKPTRLAVELENNADDEIKPPAVGSQTAEREEGNLKMLDRYADRLGSPTSASSKPSLERLQAPSQKVPPRSRSADESLSPTRSDPTKDSTRALTSPLDEQLQDSTESHEDLLGLEDSTTSKAGTISDMDYLQEMEQAEHSKRHHHHDHRTEGSLRSIRHPHVLSTSKNLLTGRFGGAFRHFEAGGHTPPRRASQELDRSLPLEEEGGDEIGLHDEEIHEEIDDLPPEVKRELERRRLSLEEKRVANAGAAYRQQLLNGSKPAKVTRASTIQNRVANLLDESGRAPPVRKTAEGYGKYTDSQVPSATNDTTRTEPQHLAATKTAPSKPTGPRTAARPNAPPKPIALRTDSAVQKSTQQTDQPVITADEDLESDFSKRYPSISLDMVESEIQKVQKPISKPGPVKTIRDV